MKEHEGKSVITIDVSGSLFIVFLVLKLCHVIDWSWLWVTAPLWGPIGIWLVLVLIWAILNAIVN